MISTFPNMDKRTSGFIALLSKIKGSIGHLKETGVLQGAWAVKSLSGQYAVVTPTAYLSRWLKGDQGRIDLELTFVIDGTEVALQGYPYRTVRKVTVIYVPVWFPGSRLHCAKFSEENDNTSMSMVYSYFGRIGVHLAAKCTSDGYYVTHNINTSPGYQGGMLFKIVLNHPDRCDGLSQTAHMLCDSIQIWT